MTDKKSSGKDWSEIVDREDDMVEQEIPIADEEDNLFAEEDQAPPSLDHASYKELEDQLTAAEKRAHENWDKASRAMAELENFRRRSETELENAHKYGVNKLLGELLPVIDSLEQALQLGVEEKGSAMLEGVELTFKLMLDVLKKFGVVQIDPTGESFDPQTHEAMSMQESADVPPNTVLTVFQKGYRVHERVIRPARVIVSKGGNPSVDEKA